MPKSLENQKKALRQHHLALRQNPEHQSYQAHKAEKICHHLSQWITGHPNRFPTICSYSAVRGEVNLLSLGNLLPPSLTIGLPRIQGQEMAFYPWKPGDALKPNAWGIPEPVSVHSVDLHQALILTPALALSPVGQRLGYGGGFYDRFAAAHPTALYLGITWGMALTPELPEDPWDMRVDGICQENGLTLLPSGLAKLRSS